MKTWKDVYKLPLRDSYIDEEFRSNRIYDADDNFVFQFLINNGQDSVLDIINGDKVKTSASSTFNHKDGYIITDKGQKIIVIRGWGNLCGTGGHNLPEDEAANIQDTFAEYIVERLNS